MEFTLLNLVLTMFVVGLGSFGGGLGAVNILKEFILRNGWISYVTVPTGAYAEMNDELIARIFRIISFMQSGGYSQGIMMSSFLGARFGVIGVILSVIAFILPSVLIVIVVFKIGQKLYKNDIFKYSLKYINLLAAGLIVVMIYNLTVIIFNLDPIFYMAIAGLACYANVFLNINPVIIVICGGIFGVIFRW